ncbi:MAG: hypothetical protein M1541_07545, partial [Acidobacteria bacterium]|nr:hypothetical protein [Acidobacteriota bacterium]
CKCMLCRASNSRYEAACAVRRREGITNRYVSAEAARAHLERLSTMGVGYKSVADSAGVARSIVSAIKYGWRRQIREETERRILSVDACAIADRALVSAGPTWQLIDELLRDGYTKQQLARWMGYPRTLQFRRTSVTALTASRVERLYRLIRDGRLARGDERKAV